MLKSLQGKSREKFGKRYDVQAKIDILSLGSED